MKKNVSLVLVITVVLLVIALCLALTGNVNGKIFNGGSAVRVQMNGSYDNEVVEDAVGASGLKSAVALESSRTCVDIEASAMGEEQLAKAAASLLSKLQETYPEAALVYAEHFDATVGNAYLRTLSFAMAIFTVVAFAYGWLRFGWVRGLVAAVTALCAAVATASASMVFSGAVSLTMSFMNISAGAACLTYLYIMVLFAKCKENQEYKPTRMDLVVPCTVVVATVLVAVIGGTAVLALMIPAVLAAVISGLFGGVFGAGMWDLPVKAAK